MNGVSPKRLVIGISGASGAIYGIRLLQILRDYDEVETHLVISAAAKRTVVEETDFTVEQVEALATKVYPNRDIGAAIASGSFRTIGMVIAPCSIKTLSAIAYCYSDSLLARAADVTLKEGRPLVALARETPLHLGHLRAMTALVEAGGIVMPPVPAFYHRPRSIDDVVNHICGHLLSRVGLAQNLAKEWKGGRAT